MLKQLDILIGLAVVFTIASLLVTMLTQLVTSVLALRGKNFVTALALALQKVAADPNKDFTLLAKHIAKDPWLSDSSLVASTFAHKVSEAYLYCSAATSDEILQSLKQIIETGKSKPDVDEIYRQATACFTDVTGSSESMFMENISKAMKRLENAAEEEPHSALKDTAKQVANELSALTAMTTTFASAFNTAMDRASQRFGYHTRFWSTILALLVVAVLQIDTLALFRQLRSDETLRRELGGLASQVLTKADTVLKEGSVTAAAVKDALLKKPLSEISKEKREKLEKVALDAATGIPKGIAEAGLSKEWIQETVKLYGESFATTMNILDSGSVGLGLKNWEAWWQWWNSSHILGVLTAWVLVCLGSPFWFNVLRSLASLRPQLAGKVDEKQSS